MTTGTQVSTKQVCHHCGAELKGELVYRDDLVFCCQGCEAVYHLLKDNNLCDYYRFSENPGRRRESQPLPADEELEVMSGEFVTYRDESRVNISFDMPAMHCTSCVWLLEKLPALRKGIGYARVDFVHKKLDLSYEPHKISFAGVVRLLDALGYRPSLLPDQKKAPISGRRTLLKLAVAGFCFGNIMLFSFPEYFGMEEAAFKSLFTWLNLALSVPVVFFSAGHFFANSLRSFRNREISVDVPLAIGIAALWLRSVYETLSQTGPGYFDSMTGLIFFLVVGKWLQERTWDSIRFDRDATKFFPLSARVLAEGKFRAVRVFDLEAGNRVEVRNGELIPGDGILMTHHALVDYSYVTGEAEPVYKVAGELVYAGGRAVNGSLEMEVVRPFTESRLRQMWSNAARSGEPVGSVSRFASRVSKWFTLGTLALATLAFLAWMPFSMPKALFAATAVLMVACPCALAIATPFALSNATRILGRNGLYLRSPEVVETLAGVNHIVFDKTGTITNPQQTYITWLGKAPGTEFQGRIIGAAAQSTHPYSRALETYFAGTAIQYPKQISEKPGMGLEATFADGVLRIGRASWVNHSDGQLQSEMHGDQAVAVSWNDETIGSFVPHNHLREGLAPMLGELRKRYDLSLLSGDGTKDIEQLEQALPGVFSSMKFRHDPAGKVAHIRELESQGKAVMMVGDGLNDAGALKAGHAGVVLAQDVTQFTPASSAILLHQDMARLPVFMRFARLTDRAGKESFYFSLLYNAVGLWFAATAQLSPVFAAILMPVSSISVALFAVARTRYFSRKEQLS
jgi:P-type Cu+ transporter